MKLFFCSSENANEIQLKSSEQISMSFPVDSWANVPFSSAAQGISSEIHSSTLMQNNSSIDEKRRALLTKTQIDPKSERAPHFCTSRGDSSALLRMKAAAAAAKAAKAHGQDSRDANFRLHITGNTVRDNDPFAFRDMASSVASPWQCEKRSSHLASGEFQAVGAI
jgi:hypothetical protein